VVEPGVRVGNLPGGPRRLRENYAGAVEMSALVCLLRRSGENRRQDPTLQAARNGAAARTDHTICSSLIGLALNSTPNGASVADAVAAGGATAPHRRRPRR
jgi:hypothetical protein